MAWAAAVANVVAPLVPSNFAAPASAAASAKILQTVMQKQISSPIKRQSDKPENSNQIDSELHQNRSVLVFVEPRQQRKKTEF